MAGLPLCWNGDNEGCAPLHVTGPVLQANYDELFTRAMSLGHTVSSDPDLMVVCDGVALPIGRDGTQILVSLPRNPRAARLVSRRFVAAQMFPGSDDHRVLGVAVAGGDLTYADGWYPPEPGLRWTNGDDAIDVSGVSELRVTLVAKGRYWVDPAPSNLCAPASRCYLADRA